MPDLPETIGYAAAADAYWQAGWKSPLPMRRGAKKYPPVIKCPEGRRDKLHRADLCENCVSYTGRTGIEPSYPDIMAWAEQFPDGNLCLRLPDGVIGIDVDDYGAKTGGKAYAEAIKRWGSLPPAPRSTSRDDDPTSGIRLFRVPIGTKLRQGISFPDLGIGDIEIIQRHHRYAICWPSIHPEGRSYWWRDEQMRLIGIPSIDELPQLPQSWLNALEAPEQAPTLSETAVDVRSVLTAGDPSPDVQQRLSQAIKELNLPGQSRHDTTCRHVLALMRLGKSGQPGVRRALELLCDVFIAATAVDKSRTADAARLEFERMITGDGAARELAQAGRTDWVQDMIVDEGEVSSTAIETIETPQKTVDPGEGKLNPGSTPLTSHQQPNDSREISHLEEIERGFWDSRESLRMIWQTAMARMAPPWGTLGHCAARALTMIPPHVVLPPIIGGPGSLNFFVATVARASGGKGASAAAANVLVPKQGFVHRKIGSGEGIIAAYGKVGDDDSDPEHPCIMFSTNEVDTFQALTTRSSSTTLPILREGFFGEDLGFAYSAKDKRRHIPEHSYRMTLIIAAQPRRMGWLLADVDGGTPQRFMWFPASDPRISRKRPWESGPLVLPNHKEWLYPRTVAVPKEAQEEIEIAHEQRSRGEGDVVDGHALFCREKFAYALAVLDGRVEMNSEDWELSKIAADVSLYTRERAKEAIAEAARVEALDRGEIRGVELAAADDSKQFEEAEKLRKALRWALKKIESAGSSGISTRDLSNAADSRTTRRWIAPALQVGASNGLIRQLDDTSVWVKI